MTIDSNKTNIPLIYRWAFHDKREALICNPILYRRLSEPCPTCLETDVISASFKLWDMSFQDIKPHCICPGSKYRTKLSNQAAMQSDLYYPRLGAWPDIWYGTIVNRQWTNSSYPGGKRSDLQPSYCPLKRAEISFWPMDIMCNSFDGKEQNPTGSMRCRDKCSMLLPTTPYYTVRSCILWDMLLHDIKLFCISPGAKYRGGIKI